MYLVVLSWWSLTSRRNRSINKLSYTRQVAVCCPKVFYLKLSAPKAHTGTEYFVCIVHGSLRMPLLFQCPNYSLLLLASPDLACAHFLHAMFDLSMDLWSPSCVFNGNIHTYETSIELLLTEQVVCMGEYWPICGVQTEGSEWGLFTRPI